MKALAGSSWRFTIEFLMATYKAIDFHIQGHRWVNAAPSGSLKCPLPTWHCLHSNFMQAPSKTCTPVTSHLHLPPPDPSPSGLPSSSCFSVPWETCESEMTTQSCYRWWRFGCGWRYLSAIPCPDASYDRGWMIGEIVWSLAPNKVLWAVPRLVDPVEQLLLFEQLLQG